MNDSAIMIVPNTKDGLYAIKYLAKEITEYSILVKLVTKKEFAVVVKNAKGDSK